jgi:hypothetical protein
MRNDLSIRHKLPLNPIIQPLSLKDFRVLARTPTVVQFFGSLDPTLSGKGARVFVPITRNMVYELIATWNKAPIVPSVLVVTRGDSLWLLETKVIEVEEPLPEEVAP